MGKKSRKKSQFEIGAKFRWAGTSQKQTSSGEGLGVPFGEGRGGYLVLHEAILQGALHGVHLSLPFLNVRVLQFGGEALRCLEGRLRVRGNRLKWVFPLYFQNVNQSENCALLVNPLPAFSTRQHEGLRPVPNPRLKFRTSL